MDKDTFKERVSERLLQAYEQQRFFKDHGKFQEPQRHEASEKLREKC